MPPDLRDWPDEDHLAWFVIEAIEELDLEPFYASYRAVDDLGSPHGPPGRADHVAAPMRGAAGARAAS
jgi:hypothetical protein